MHKRAADIVARAGLTGHEDKGGVARVHTASFLPVGPDGGEFQEVPRKCVLCAVLFISMRRRLAAGSPYLTNMSASDADHSVVRKRKSGAMFATVQVDEPLAFSSGGQFAKTYDAVLRFTDARSLFTHVSVLRIASKVVDDRALSTVERGAMQQCGGSSLARTSRRRDAIVVGCARGCAAPLAQHHHQTSRGRRARPVRACCG